MPVAKSCGSTKTYLFDPVMRTKRCEELPVHGGRAMVALSPFSVSIAVLCACRAVMFAATANSIVPCRVIEVWSEQRRCAVVEDRSCGCGHKVEIGLGRCDNKVANPPRSDKLRQGSL